MVQIHLAIRDLETGACHGDYLQCVEDLVSDVEFDLVLGSARDLEYAAIIYFWDLFAAPR